MKVKNEKWRQLHESDFFIFTIGHEPRSSYIYDQNSNSRNKENTLAFCFDDKGSKNELISELKKKEIAIINCSYADSNLVQQTIANFYQEKITTHGHIQLHIDYSSMPRSWYCSIPMYMSSIINAGSTLFFWYNTGRYPRSYKNYPSAAIDSISVFSGLSLPAIDIKRYHIMGLGLDSIRTETVKTIVEPDLLICCYAYNPNNVEIKKQVYEVNKRVIQSASLVVSLPLDNLEGMVDKLCGLAYDLLLKDAQVIFIPDGPKPLIMAMSIVPQLIDKPGITCLHIASNTNYYPRIAIQPRDNEIFGFQLIGDFCKAP